MALADCATIWCPKRWNDRELLTCLKRRGGALGHYCNTIQLVWHNTKKNQNYGYWPKGAAQVTPAAVLFEHDGLDPAPRHLHSTAKVVQHSTAKVVQPKYAGFESCFGWDR